MKNQSLLSRLGFAINGIRSAFKEPSFRTQSVAVPLVIGVLVYTKAPAVWWAIMSIMMGLVLAAELLNTALESAIDRLHPQQNEAIKVAKDCAAGAVLVLSITSLAVFAAFLCAYVR